MTVKYRPWVCALAVLIAACAPTAAVSSPSPIPTTDPSATASSGLAVPVATSSVAMRHRWQLIPDGFMPPAPEVGQNQVVVRFADDPLAGRPIARLQPGGRETALVGPTTGPNVFVGVIDLAGLSPGAYAIEIVEHLSGGREAVVGTADFMLSQPEYVLWTLDFEGDASGDAELANTAAIADGLRLPMTVFWNPRVWTTTQVSAERRAAMLAWTKARQAKGDEIALHLHLWTDYVRASGVTPKTTPSWAGRGDGYDVPITAYSEAEQRTLIDAGVTLMVDHALPRPTTFRAGGDMADATTLRAAAAAGFDLDSTAVATDYPAIGRIPYPWNLPVGAQPYRPSRTDANVAGDLPLLEVPVIGGNTYGYTVNSIQPQIRANLALFAPSGKPATERKTITVVSHPGTIVPAERAAIEALLRAFDGLRYDRDAGPVRFVTAAQLARAYRP